MPVSVLAERIGTHRNTLSNWIADGQFSVAMLRKISLQLERNFFQALADDLSEEMPGLRVVREAEPPSYGKPKPTMTSVRIDVDVADPAQQDMVLDFADKLRRVQERHRE